MKKTNVRLLLLIFVVIAGIVTGAYFLYVSRWHYPLQFVLGIICFLASVTAIISYRLYRKGRTGRFYNVVAFITVLFTLPVVFYTVVLIVMALGFEIFPPQQ